jgi:Starch-binding associating with outer membrane
MIYKKLTNVAAGVTLALSLSACNDRLTDLNVNPNGPTDVDAEYLFPQGVSSVVGVLRGEWFDLRMTSLWAQHYAAIQYVEDGDTYEVRPSVVELVWSLYPAGLEDLTQAADKATALGNTNKAGPAKIMKLWTLGVLTELWGDIPFSEANNVDKEGGTTTPKYDAQQAIYTAIFADLKSAHDEMGTGTGYGAADPIYGGSVSGGRKFANSLRARHAMRLSKVDEPKARAELAAALAAGVFTSNADDAKLVWPGGGNASPLHANAAPPDGTGSRDDHRVSKTLVDTLKSLSDPRLAVYAQCTDESEAAGGCEYVGVPNGLSNADAALLGFTRTSKLGSAFFAPQAPSWLMSYPEVLFIQAEAAQRGWITTGTAASFYNAGITASLEQWGISAANIAIYLAQPQVAYNPLTGFTQIALQKWIALYGQGSDAWAEYRRTGVPDLKAGPAAIIPTVARRLTYPVSEQSFNKANLDAAIAAQGGAALTNRVWWDMP